MKDKAVLRVSSKLLMPPIMLFALYVQFHGDFGPGGGFQAGVIFASAFILYALLFGVSPGAPGGARRRRPRHLGLGGFALRRRGVAGLLLGGNYLNYSVLARRPGCEDSTWES